MDEIRAIDQRRGDEFSRIKERDVLPVCEYNEKMWCWLYDYVQKEKARITSNERLEKLKCSFDST